MEIFAFLTPTGLLWTLSWIQLLSWLPGELQGSPTSVILKALQMQTRRLGRPQTMNGFELSVETEGAVVSHSRVTLWPMVAQLLCWEGSLEH